MNRTFSSLSLQFRQNHKTPVRSVNDLYVVPRTFKQVKKDQALLPSSSLSPLFLVSAAELPLDISCLFWFGLVNRTFSTLLVQFRQNHKTLVRSVTDLYAVPRTF